MPQKESKNKGLKKGFKKLEGMIEETVSSLQVGTDGFDKLTAVIEELQVQFQNMDQLKNSVGKNDSDFLVEMTSLSNETNKILNDIVEAMMSQDVVLLADLLEYELKPRMTTWQYLSRDLERRIN